MIKVVPRYRGNGGKAESGFIAAVKVRLCARGADSASHSAESLQKNSEKGTSFSSIQTADQKKMTNLRGLVGVRSPHDY